MSSAREMVLGAAGATSAAVITHPLDVIKVRMLLHGELQVNNLPKLQIVKEIIRNEGPLSLYKGLSATVLRHLLFQSTRFGAVDAIRKAFPENQRKSIAVKATSTVLAGGIGAFIASPAEVALVRMQVDGRLPPAMKRNYRNVFSAIYSMVRTEGVMSCYRGLGALLARGVGVTSAQFLTYDAAKHVLGNDQVLLSGLASSVVATLVSTPCDTIKSRMMSSDISGRQRLASTDLRPVGETPMYNSSLDCLRQTLRSEGVRGLYKGFTPAYVRSAPQVALMWWFYEGYRKLWDSASAARNNSDTSRNSYPRLAVSSIMSTPAPTASPARN